MVAIVGSTKIIMAMVSLVGSTKVIIGTSKDTLYNLDVKAFMVDINKRIEPIEQTSEKSWKVQIISQNNHDSPR